VIPRPVAALALAALLLGGAGVAAAITHDDGGGEAARTAVTTTSSVVVDTTTTTLEPTTTTAAGVTTTMARDNANTTTSRPARTTTTRAATTTSTTAAASECTRAQIEVTATTDKSSYGPGQQVKVDSTLRNRSRTTCVYAGHTFQVAIQDAAGRTIITFELIAPGPTGTPFVPGATLTGSVPWDQRTCQTQPCPQPPPGAYSAAAKWTFAGGPYEARAAFTLVP
jgi:hypothetical protein